MDDEQTITQADVAVVKVGRVDFADLTDEDGQPLPWPRELPDGRGGTVYVTSDRYRFRQRERAEARQANLDGES